MTWYRAEDQSFLYAGDLALLGIDPANGLPEGIVAVTFTPSPESSDPLIGYKIDGVVNVDGQWETNWVEVVHTQEEYDLIVEEQKIRTANDLAYLKKEI